MSLYITEIFHSIQGESGYAGHPCVFVRLSGCNLRCRYCDTRYAWEPGKRMEIAAVTETVAGYGCDLVEVTGGEPLMQEQTPELIDALLKKGFRVLLETNGSLDIDLADPSCVRIMDIKCPSSGETAKTDFENLKRLNSTDEVKFVIGDRADYEYAKEQLSGIPEIPIHFSPVSGLMSPALLAEWILADRLRVRLGIQLHKVIWGPDKTGV